MLADMPKQNGAHGTGSNQYKEVGSHDATPPKKLKELGINDSSLMVCLQPPCESMAFLYFRLNFLIKGWNPIPLKKMTLIIIKELRTKRKSYPQTKKE